MGAPQVPSLEPLRVDSALRALSTLRGLRGAPEAPPLCRETQSLGQQMLKAPVGINGLNPTNITSIWFRGLEGSFSIGTPFHSFREVLPSQMADEVFFFKFTLSGSQDILMFLIH